MITDRCRSTEYVRRTRLTGHSHLRDGPERRYLIPIVILLVFGGGLLLRLLSPLSAKGNSILFENIIICPLDRVGKGQVTGECRDHQDMHQRPLSLRPHIGSRHHSLLEKRLLHLRTFASLNFASTPGGEKCTSFLGTLAYCCRAAPHQKPSSSGTFL